jgi:hypothetical protein
MLWRVYGDGEAVEYWKRGAPNEQRQFTEEKIPLYPPFPKGEDLNSLLCKRRAGEDFKAWFIPSITPSTNGVRGSL